MTLEKSLSEFRSRNLFGGKGPLAVALYVGRKAAERGLPLQPESLLDDASERVRGLGRPAVQAILKDHGIRHVLSREGGRTSRCSVANLRTYVAFLNTLPVGVDLKVVENFWIEKVRAYFSGKALQFRIDGAWGVRAAVYDLMRQARARQIDKHRWRCAHAMLRHLVGAQLDLVLGKGIVKHHSVPEAYLGKDRAGDFTPGDVAIHIAVFPRDALPAKCIENLKTGIRPIVVTAPGRLAAIDGLLDTANIADRVDVLDIEQFLAANLHEHALFQRKSQRPKVGALIDRYNELIDEFENEPALRIEITK